MMRYEEVELTRDCEAVEIPQGTVVTLEAETPVVRNWTHDRKKKGTFHATDYNSLICGCDGTLCGIMRSRLKDTPVFMRGCGVP